MAALAREEEERAMMRRKMGRGRDLKKLIFVVELV